MKTGHESNRIPLNFDIDFALSINKECYGSLTFWGSLNRIRVESIVELYLCEILSSLFVVECHLFMETMLILVGLYYRNEKLKVKEI